MVQPAVRLGNVVARDVSAGKAQFIDEIPELGELQF